MRPVFLCLTFALGFLLSASHAVAHPLHLTVSEVTYNRDTAKLEVAMRFFPDDLETVLTKEAGRPVSVSKPEDIASNVLPYLKRTWLTKATNGKASTVEWAGLDITDTHVWVFFEFSLPGGLLGAELHVTSLQELFDDQLNSVQLRDGAFKQTLIFAKTDQAKRVSATR